MAKCGARVLAALALVFAATAASADAPSGGATAWLATPAGRLKARVFVSPQASAHPVLVVVLHGDAPFEKPDYQYRFAASAAAAGDVVAAAILRPGYADPTGDASDGVRGMTTGDNYTRDRIDMIVAAIRDLAAAHHARSIVLVGHSGGAAISADILALYPKLARGALLVSCPCDLGVWRAHMKAAQAGAAIWDQPVASLSPIDHAAEVDRGAVVDLMVGEADDVAPPPLTDAYAAALRRRGVTATVTHVPGAGHNILLQPAVLQQLRALLDQFGG